MTGGFAPRTPAGYFWTDEMSDRSFLDWPFFETRHRELSAALEEWAAGHLPVDHSDVDTACKGLVRDLGRRDFCGIPGLMRAKCWMSGAFV